MKNQSNPPSLRWTLTGFVVLLATSLFLTGCVVTSAYPYYREQDLVIDEALIGDWSVTTRSHSF